MGTVSSASPASLRRPPSLRQPFCMQRLCNCPRKRACSVQFAAARPLPLFSFLLILPFTSSNVSNSPSTAFVFSSRVDPLTPGEQSISSRSPTTTFPSTSMVPLRFMPCRSHFSLSASMYFIVFVFSEISKYYPRCLSICSRPCQMLCHNFLSLPHSHIHRSPILQMCSFLRRLPGHRSRRRHIQPRH